MLILSFLIFAFGVQASPGVYPKAMEDSTVPSEKAQNIELFEIKESELGPILKAARMQAESATTEDISKAGILIPGLRGDEAREKYKSKLIENLVTQRNLELIRKMNALPIPTPSEPGKVSALTAQQIRETAASIEYSPATDARQSLTSKYNPNGDIGYCFLRAHYYAGAVDQRGLDMSSVRKVFLIGTMKLFGANWIPSAGWRYHVATAVRGVDGKWYVLDNHMALYLGKHGYSSRAFTVEEWYKYYEKFMNTTDDLSAHVASDGSKEVARSKALFLYFADADHVIPEGTPYTKNVFYGIDKNKDGKLDASEVNMNGAFVDVDNFLSVAIHPCSKERCAPLNPLDEKCRNLSTADQQILRQRELLLNQWRLETSFEEEQRMLPPSEVTGSH